MTESLAGRAFDLSESELDQVYQAAVLKRGKFPPELLERMFASGGTLKEYCDSMASQLAEKNQRVPHVLSDELFQYLRLGLDHKLLNAETFGRTMSLIVRSKASYNSSQFLEPLEYRGAVFASQLKGKCLVRDESGELWSVEFLRQALLSRGVMEALATSALVNDDDEALLRLREVKSFRETISQLDLRALGYLYGIGPKASELLGYGRISGALLASAAKHSLHQLSQPDIHPKVLVPGLVAYVHEVVKGCDYLALKKDNFARKLAQLYDYIGTFEVNIYPAAVTVHDGHLAGLDAMEESADLSLEEAHRKTIELYLSAKTIAQKPLAYLLRCIPIDLIKQCEGGEEVLQKRFLLFREPEVLKRITDRGFKVREMGSGLNI